MNEFKSVRVSKEDLQKVIDSFDGDYCHFGIEMDSIEGDQILWASNGKFDDRREVVIINKPWKQSVILNVCALCGTPKHNHHTEMGHEFTALKASA